MRRGSYDFPERMRHRRDVCPIGFGVAAALALALAILAILAVDRLSDGRDQLLDRAARVSFDLLLGEQGEEALDLIEP